MSAGCWVGREAAQVEYERLRVALLADEGLEDSLAWHRLQRHGLGGLIDWRGGRTPFIGCSLVGARRPRWSGAADPRQGRLAEVYGFLLASGEGAPTMRAVGS